MIQEVLTERPPVDTNGTVPRRCKLSAHYRALVQRIRAASMASPAHQTIETIGVTSCARGAGVSTVAFNIAVAAVHVGIEPVLYVDSDVNKKSNRRLIRSSPTLGLADALAEAVEPMDCIVSTSIENLSIVAGRGKTRHDELTFDPFKAAELINEFKCQFKMVIVDIPAPTDLNGSIYLASRLDAVLLVIEAELSDGRVALRTKQQLVDSNANVLGVVLNKRRKNMPNWLNKLL